MSLVPSNAPTMSDTMAGHAMPLDSEPSPMMTGNGDGNVDSDDDANQPQKPSDADFSSMFSDAEAVAERLMKTNERK